jgi:hypothetical protein
MSEASKAPRRRWPLYALGTAVLVVGAVIAYRQFVLLPSLRDMIRERLKDPASAQFRDERVVGGWLPAWSFYCGQVNAKNGMGGYSGFAYFTVKPWDIDFPHDKPAQISECDDRAKNQAAWWWLRW